MKTNLCLISLRPIGRALYTAALAGVLVFSASAQPPAQAPAPQPGQAPGGPPRGGRGPGAPIIPGPPAAVPAVVAIPRPSEAEVAQANEALKKFLASDATGKALQAKYPGLIAVT